jgi:hypothetical protein
MRSDTAARQASKLETILAKALLNMPAGHSDEHTANTVSEISLCLMEAYALGGVEALQVAPWQYTEVAYRDRVTVDALNRQGAQGWEAWAITDVLLPKHAGETTPSVPGHLVRYRRRVAPKELGAANDYQS